MHSYTISKMATYPSLAGKVIAISGAVSGMGLALAKLLYPMGCRLSLTDINKDTLDAAIQQINPFSDSEEPPAGTILTTAADVCSSSEVDAWIAATVEMFGRLDGAANLAGIIGKFRKLTEFSDED
jgi:NAD(P)-dependent dehydrogenase (short-subunit alcohol dehydrogenase family)